MDREKVISNCRILLERYRKGELGYTKMPEDSNPFSVEGGRETVEEEEERLAYFTLPMSLNYQRNSYKLWEGVLRMYGDSESRVCLDVKEVCGLNLERVRELLLRYKVALQPNKHINTWIRICKSVFENWGSIKGLLEFCDYDYLKLRQVLQVDYKKGFPYLSGPKIFNYWCFILGKYCNCKLKNKKFIEIAPDTHVIKGSLKLGVIREEENLSREEISARWRSVLEDSGISPIDMHSPLWFWSRNGFKFVLRFLFLLFQI